MVTRGKMKGMVLGVFSFSLLLSAALMFALQPMAGKMLLPLVGGTPAGWIVAMAFFQVMLLLGYLLAHLFSHFSPRQHALLYLLALLAGATFLPISLAGHAGYDSAFGPGKVFLLLTQALSVPFIALSATSSTLQRLFTAAKHGDSNDPYFLYVASNLGSFAGLLLYPFLIEPMLGLGEQSTVIAGGYVLLIAMGAACLALSGKNRKTPSARQKAAAPLSIPRQVEWMALAFIPSSLLMSVTTYITSDIISAPLIWILPLALYLLTFIIAFSRKHLVSLRVMEAAHPYVICIAVFFITLIRADWLYNWFGVFFYLSLFAVVALTCHMRLASLRPLDDSRHLTSFYLAMSVGGALGGVLNAFVIPNMLNRLIEFPLFMLASFMVNSNFSIKSRTGIGTIGLIVLSVLLTNMHPLVLGVESKEAQVWFFRFVTLAVPIALFAFRSARKPSSIALMAFGIFMISQFVIGDQTEYLSLRNFFGTIRLYDSAESLDGKDIPLRTMRHGSTTHGKQMMGSQKLEATPTAYYTRKGPLGDVFSVIKPKHVAVLGLGAGATNCYTAPDREFTFLEIDPDVVEVAKHEFTFLSKCASKTPPKIITGDGRLALADLSDKFDLLIVDVFTSDTIPTHIVTQEALKTYFAHIKPGGVMVMNISNRYFSLADTIATTAATLGLVTALKEDLSPVRPFYSSPSIWIVVSRGVEPPAFSTLGWHRVTPSGKLRPWTDNYTNLLAALTVPK